MLAETLDCVADSFIREVCRVPFASYFIYLMHPLDGAR